MNWTVFFTALITIIGWLIYHFLASRRDQANKRREKRIEYMIEIWRKLERAADRGKDKSLLPNMEEAIADIQLLGNKKQVELAIQTAEKLAKEGTVTVKDILKQLRDDLRKELKLEKINEEIKSLRMTGQYYNYFKS